MQKILPDIYLLDGSSSNFYLCVDQNGLFLVDTGMPKRAHLVWAAIEKLGRERSDLNRILITHADLDHAGSAAAIQAETGATIYTGAETAELLKRGKSPKHMPWFAQFILDYFMGYTAVSFHNIHICLDGEQLPMLGGLQVITAPGHTLDQHAFYSPSRGILFAGDALNTRQDRLQITPKSVTADITAAHRTAIRLLQYHPQVIACGHGKPLDTTNRNDASNLLNQLQKELP